jgi:glycosyltransferase involved in cell wall biosynthesis
MMTYNGARFLDAQIESLLQQELVSIKIFACDDGSTDETLEILKFWRGKGRIQRIFQSAGIGPTAGFQNLLKMSKGAEYVAFCDQDDIWHPKKLITQIGFIESKAPTLVFSLRNYIDESGGRLISPPRVIGNPSFENALIENLAPGNTQLLNMKAIDLLISFHNNNIVHYDAWIYLVMAALGKCIQVPSPLVDYRIHEDNLVGLRKKFPRNVYGSIDSYKKQAFQLKNYAENELSQEKLLYLKRFLALFGEDSKFARVKAINKLKLARSSKKDASIIKFYLVAGVIFGKV